jgi:capsular polysaccharide biosynthesis protein
VSATEQDVASRLAWGLRRYAAVIAVAVLVAVALTLSGPARALLTPARSYESSALIVAQELQIKPEQLPRTADAVFNGGSVAATVAEELGDPSLANRLIPSRIRLEPLNDTIALRIVGRSTDPDGAARYANLGADAFLDELNRLGSGVGVFALQDQARPPERQAKSASPIVPLTLGTAGGVILGIGIVMLLLTLRRPVLSSTEASEVAGAPLVALLELPRSKAPVNPEAVSGLGLLARQLFPSGTGVAALIGCGGRDGASRPEVLRLLALLLSRRTTVFLLGARAERIDDLDASLKGRQEIRVVREGLLDLLEGGGARERVAASTSQEVVLLGVDASAYDVPQLLPSDARSVLYVPEGTPHRAVDHAARQFGPGELSGVAFVRRPSRLRSRAAAAAASSSGATAGSGAGRIAPT